MMYKAFLEDLCALKRARVNVSCFMYGPVGTAPVDELQYSFRYSLCCLVARVAQQPCSHQWCSEHLAFVHRSSNLLGWDLVDHPQHPGLHFEVQGRVCASGYGDRCRAGWHISPSEVGVLRGLRASRICWPICPKVFSIIRLALDNRQLNILSATGKPRLSLGYIIHVLRLKAWSTTIKYCVSLSSFGSWSAGGKPMILFSMASFNSESVKIWASDAAPLDPTSAQMNL